MRPNQTYKLLRNKGNHRQTKKTMDWEKIFVNDATDEGKFIQLNNKNNKKKTQKMGRRSKLTFLQRTHGDGQ